MRVDSRSFDARASPAQATVRCVVEPHYRIVAAGRDCSPIRTEARKHHRRAMIPEAESLAAGLDVPDDDAVYLVRRIEAKSQLPTVAITEVPSGLNDGE